jgi:hypothetical protein
MSDGGWTPGPWRVMGKVETRLTRHGVGTSNGVVVDVDTEADARLIAAAPRLAKFVDDIAGAPVTAVGDEYRAEARAILEEITGGSDVSA